MWGFVDIFDTPNQLLLRSLSLIKAIGKLGVDHSGNPIHHENFPTGKALGFRQDGNGLFHPTDPAQQWNRMCMLGSQQPNRAQIQRLLNIRQPRLEFLQPHVEKLNALRLHIGIGILPHQQEQ